jgi:hypothetical protein
MTQRDTSGAEDVSSASVHTHIGAINAFTVLLFIALLGTVWRLSAVHLIATDNTTAKGFGQAMLFQF